MGLGSSGLRKQWAEGLMVYLRALLQLDMSQHGLEVGKNSQAWGGLAPLTAT